MKQHAPRSTTFPLKLALNFVASSWKVAMSLVYLYSSTLTSIFVV